MTHAVVLAILLAGFACLSLSMTRHQSEVLMRPLPPLPGRLLRGCGFLLIATGLPVSIAFHGGGLGAVAWFGGLSLAAGAIFLALLWRRQMQKR